MNRKKARAKAPDPVEREVGGSGDRALPPGARDERSAVDVAEGEAVSSGRRRPYSALSAAPCLIR